MKKILLQLLISSSIFALNPGDKALDFALINQNGENIELNNLLKEGPVILEWYNDGCPFVRKHYDSKNMQNTQQYALANGYTWVSINSSNVGNQGHLESPKKAKERLSIEGSFAKHLLIDTDGRVGKMYDAKTTPEIFIIAQDKNIIYHGAIDSISSADKNDLKNATNYVIAAIDDLKNSSTVKIKKTKSYGCSVKY